MATENRGLIVVKIGGSTLGSNDTTLQDLVTLQQKHVPVVVVHGGAKVVSEWLIGMNISPSFVRGLRVTDEKTLKVVTAVLAGLVNKELVAALQVLGGRAIGISGVDGGLVRAQIANPELGLVGEIGNVNTGLINTMLEAGYMPVVASVSLASGNDLKKGIKMLNVNADNVAGEIAAAMRASKLIFLTDVEGIYDGSGNLMRCLSASDLPGLSASGTASRGMAVKVDACAKALSGVPVVRIIDGRAQHALLQEMTDLKMGTTITR